MNSDYQSLPGSPTEMVYIINSLHTGGAEIGMRRLLSGLDPEKYNVTVFALDGHSVEFTNQIPSWVQIVDLQLRSGIGISTLRELYSSVRSADVIVGSLYHSSMIARLCRFIRPTATIATWHHANLFESDIRRSTFRWTALLSDVVLADSDSVAEMLISDLGLSRDRVHTVPIAGIDLDEYTSKTHGDTDEITVGTIGRLTKQKNQQMVLDIAERLLESNIQFEIAGDGELYEELQAEIEERELTNVTLHGFVDDVPVFLEGLDIYLQPSRWEGLCITVLEAMATGLPVVGSDVGGVGRNVEDGASGYLYPPSDISGFVSGIERLAADPQRRASFGKRGREIVAASFTQDVLIESFENAVRGG